MGRGEVRDIEVRRQGGEEEFWTPAFWKGYFDVPNRYRRYKLARDAALAMELLRPQAGELILELGCGYGRISRVLLEAAAFRLVGVDFSASMLQSCREWVGCSASGLCLCRAD